jgi:DNA-binding transcriptional LysR family regulator
VPPTRARANAPDLLLRLARAGAGITTVADNFAAPYIHSGELMPVLVDWSLPSTQAWAVFPGRRLMPARTRAFLDWMEAKLAGPTCCAARQAEALHKEQMRIKHSTIVTV